MSDKIQDKQASSYEKLVTTDIAKLINGSNFEVGKYSFTFEAAPINLNEVNSYRGTKYVSVNAACTISNGKESIRENLHLLKLPLLTDAGFVIGENLMQVLDLYSKTLGWSFTDKVSKEGVSNIKAALTCSHGCTITYSYIQGKTPSVLFNRSSDGSKKNVPIGVFLRAITGYTNEDLAVKFGHQNGIVTQIFASDNGAKSRNDCIEQVAHALLGENRCAQLYSVPAYMRAITNSLMKPSYLSVGIDGTRRLEYLQSYVYRAQNKIIADTVRYGDFVLKKGEILHSEQLSILDAIDIPCLRVKHGDKVYELHKHAKYTFPVYGLKLTTNTLGIPAGKELTLADVEVLNNSDLTSITVVSDIKGRSNVTYTRQLFKDYLDANDYLAAFDIWVNNANGYDSFDNDYELTNRLIVPFATSALNCISVNLNAIRNQYEDALEIVSGDASLLQSLPDISSCIDPLRLINSITNTKSKTTQTADNTNILSRVAKSHKITSTIDGQSVTPELVYVQDMQEGRLDTLDVPESTKIGIVHNKTILSEIDENGYITQPFIRIDNGKVVSEEPVYLNASQELNQYVAEWNETFVDEDGNPKQSILARYNGDILTVPLHDVTLQEYSPYQSMSISHATIPFPGHSNGKRITMSCNQQKQAVPTVRSTRPFVNGGGESLLDVGLIKVSDIITKFVNKSAYFKNCEEELKGSSVQLISMEKGIRSNKGKRMYTFKVLKAVELRPDLSRNDYEVCIDAAYLAKGSEENISTYRLIHKDDHVYEWDEVVLHDIGMQVSDQELVMHVDTGHHKLSSEIFKTGIGLSNNLTVVIKTCEGSTIDDACVISDRLVYDDTLTSLYIFSVVEECKKFDGAEEYFGADTSSAPDYFRYNGLPKIGSVLKAGDPVICKNSRAAARSDEVSNGAVTGSDHKPKYTYLRDCKEGQVIATHTYTKDHTMYAEVVIATRASIEVGDKLAGRHGNKSVIAKIKPMSEMPYNPKTGMTADIVLNPLGIPSRQNVSQLLDIPMSYALREQNKLAIMSPYNKDDNDFVTQFINAANVHPEMLIDGRTGQYFSRPVNYGVISMYKLHHMARRKIHAIGFDAPVGVGDLQPKKGSKFNGGQAIGEMETWCLQGMGADHVMQELFSSRSDDVNSKTAMAYELRSGKSISEVTGENYNDLSLQTFYRTLGAEITVDVNDEIMSFKPVTDKITKGLSSAPVANKEQLHAASIFGQSTSPSKKASSRDRWGWIDLNTKIVNPLFLYKGNLGAYLMCSVITDEKERVISITKKRFDDFLANNTYVDTASAFPYHLYSTAETINRTGRSLESLAEANRASLLTGMPAIVWLLEHTDPADVLQVCRNTDKLSKDSTDAGDVANHLTAYLDGGGKLSDFVISSFPVMPQIHRVSFKNLNRVASADWHYARILQAAAEVKKNNTAETQYELYKRILSFLGIDAKYENKKHPSVCNIFAGKGSKGHGYIRKKMLSKRIFASGRTIIVPTGDMKMKPTEIGTPYLMIIKMYEEQLINIINKFANPSSNAENAVKRRDAVRMLLGIASDNIDIFYEAYTTSGIQARIGVDFREAFRTIDKLIREFIESENKSKEVVITGRQPSLHKYSLRAFHPKIVKDKAIHIHPLVCKGYNADFDGDQMYEFPLFSEEAKNEAMAVMSAMVDTINPKDSSLILDHSQDMSLGIYFMTMLKGNAASVSLNWDDALPYTSIEHLRSDVDLHIIEPSDLVSIRVNGRVYCALAGRVLFNSIFKDGFTDKPFSNVLGIQGVKSNRIYDLKYDAVITCGKPAALPVAIKLSSITKSLYLGKDEDWMDTFQALAEFGFTYSDYSGISLSIEDLNLDYGKEEILRDGNSKKEQLELDYLNGLVTKEDKIAAVHEIYDPGSKEGMHELITKAVNNAIKPDNNINIIMNSGARGNAAQLMAMCGIIGSLQKTKTEDMESPVLSDYTTGLSAFDVHMASYSARIGVQSTQNETSSAGYATHKVVFLASGMEIVEEDCGMDVSLPINNYEVHWGAHRQDLDLCKPSPMWLRNNLLGKTVAPFDIVSMHAFNLSKDNRVITEDNLAQFNLISSGFNTVILENNEAFCVNVGFSEPTNADLCKLLSTALNTNKCILEGQVSPLHKEYATDASKFSDAEKQQLLSSISSVTPQLYSITPLEPIGPLPDASKDELLTNIVRPFADYEDGNVICTRRCVKSILKHHVMSVMMKDGSLFKIRYDIDKACRSMLANRITVDSMPFAESRIDKTYGKKISVVTPETIDYVVENGETFIPVRTMLKCRSKHGVCAHCYGLSFSSLQLPKVKTPVGYESAQAIGEPAAQLTISLINKGGAAGASVASGVALFDNLLEGKVPGEGTKQESLAAPYSGYVRYAENLGKTSIYIEPVGAPNCNLCAECNQLTGNVGCPREDGMNSRYMCTIGNRVDKNLILYDNGEFIQSGEQLILDGVTNGRDASGSALDNLNMYSLMSPNAIEKYHDSQDVLQVWAAKQMQVVFNYFRTFLANHIDINARHFELISRIQNLYIKASEEKGDVSRGDMVEVPEVLSMNDQVKGQMRILNKEKATILNSGAITALVFENVTSIAAQCVINGTKQSLAHNYSKIAKVASGFNVANDTIKPFKQAKYHNSVVKESDKNSGALTIEEIASQNLEKLGNDVDFNDIFGMSAFDFPDMGAVVSDNISMPEETRLKDIIVDMSEFAEENEDTDVVEDKMFPEDDNPSVSKLSAFDDVDDESEEESAYSDDEDEEDDTDYPNFTDDFADEYDDDVDSDDFFSDTTEETPNFELGDYEEVDPDDLQDIPESNDSAEEDKDSLSKLSAF